MLKGMSRSPTFGHVLISKTKPKAKGSASIYPKPTGAVLKRIKAVEKRADDFRAAMIEADKAGLSGAMRWKERIEPEKKQIKKLLDGKLEATPDRIEGAENNLKGLERELADAKKMGASAVNVDAHYIDATGAPNHIDIDNLATVNGDTIWTEVKGYKSFSAEPTSSNWSDMEDKCARMILAAEQNNVKHIRWSFTEEVSLDVKQALESMSTSNVTVTVDSPVIVQVP